MKSFTEHKGIIAPINRSNIDTDIIISKQYLSTIEKSGLGAYVFDVLRFSDEGYLGKTDRTIKQDFILNKQGYTQSTILLCKMNFGCGSSREHAVWALQDYGFCVVIAQSFADIFRNNCFKNGMLPVQLSASAINELFELSSQPIECYVNLADQCIQVGKSTWQFDIEENRKSCLLAGLDEIGVTLEKYKQAISDYEYQAKKKFPWIFRGLHDE